jgi:hypothetical protein
LFNESPWTQNIGKDHGRAKENIVFYRYSLVDGNIVLHFHPVSESNFVSHKAVLAENAIFTHPGTGHEMAIMPDLGTFSNLTSLVKSGRRMRKEISVFQETGTLVLFPELPAFFRGIVGVVTITITVTVTVTVTVT